MTDANPSVHNEFHGPMMSFLKDAHERNLLRATGPVYRFRHARLQERLARPAK
ncbi:hypothetical protein [Streptomyces sp. NPDC048710]|uniref:hypothetical protein n=1 Tax=Streptomyces sp. NPDC048710 TaxID=3365586 RepID=UPI00371E57D0